MNKLHTKIKDKIKISDELRTILYQCLIFALGFFLTPIRFIFNIYPFSLALLASCKRYAPFAFAGSILSVYFNMSFNLPYAVALCALFALRITGSLWLNGGRDRENRMNMEYRRDMISSFFTENEGVRVALCAFSALGISIHSVIKSEFSYYEIFLLAFFVTVSSVLTYALCGLYEDSGSPKRLVALCALAFICVFAIKGIELFTLDLSIIFSYALALYASKNVSPAKGAALGALLGICQKIVFAPVFAIASLISGFLWRFSIFLSVMSAFTVSVGYGLFTSGYEAIVYLVPELLLTTLVMYPVLRFEALPRPRLTSPQSDSVTVNEILSKRSSEATKENFRRVSDSLMEISRLLCDFGSRERSVSIESRYDSCLEICEANCYSCPKKSICWERDSLTTKENIDKLSVASYYNKSVSKTDIDEKFLHRCPNIDTIIDKINQKCKEEEESLLKNDKLEVSYMDYENISKMLGKESKRLEEEFLLDSVLTDRVKRACDSIGLIYEGIGVYGGVKKRIIATGVDKEGSKCTVSALTSELERALGRRILPPLFEGESPLSVMTVDIANKYAIESARLSGKSEGDEQNGDTVSAFLSCDNKFYMLICDGMGSGKEASSTSKICAEFLKKLLYHHPDKEVSLSMANNFLRNKKTECSSSVDLLEIDLVNGKSSFLKSGAAPSYVKRGDKVFKLFSKTAPIGIMKKPDCEELDFNLQENDIVVMISDGICQGDDDDLWLTSALSDADSHELDTLPSLIISRSKERGLSYDDKSVCVCAVRKAVAS